MNKHCYRIIFSRTHGELRVVSELARSCSTEPGQSRGNGTPRLWVTLRRAAWLLGMALFAGPAMANGIVADSNATPGQRPDVIATQNGLPQVNITAPNQAGISHNQYQQFDVAQNGAILNNSAVMTSTQLAGMIQGNPNLNPDTPAARVIINEVNSNNPSQLRGYMEVAGGRAQVIVANPAGIVCNGCGTINAGRMTLTTGKPQLNADGSLAGYQVERGVVRIEGGGLNGDPRHDTEYVDVLARAVEINAGVWAKKELAVVAGRNRVSADAQTVTPLADDGSARPELAIDMGQMGGMYSGQIRMIGTEAGVGVRNQNAQVQAGKTLVVSSEGKLVWQSAAQDGVTQAGGDISLAAREDIDYQGKLHSGGQLTVRSREGGITQSGTLAAAGDVRLTAARSIQSSGHLLAGSDASSQVVQEANLQLESQDTIRASGSLLSKKEVSARGRRVDLSGAQVTASRAMLTAQEGGVAVRQAVINGTELVINTAGDIEAQQAQISAGRWQIDGRSLFSQQAGWSQTGSGESRFTLSGGLDNSDGAIESRQLSFRAASLNNQRGRMVALDNAAQKWRIDGLLDNTAGELGNNGDLTLETGSLTNQGGTVKTQALLAINARTAVNNSQGKLLAGDALTLSAGGDLDNHAGTLNGGQLSLTAQHLNNVQGEIVSQRDLDLTTLQGLDNSDGWIEAGHHLSLNSGGLWQNRDGTAQGGERVTATTDQLNNVSGRLQSGGDLDLTGRGDILNQGGKLTAKNALAVHGTAATLFDNDGGSLQSGSDLLLQGGALYNRQSGQILSQQALTLNLAGDWDNQGGTLTGNGRTQASAANLLNAQGAINALDTLDMQVAGRLDNNNGRIFSRLSQTLQAQEMGNAQGWMGSQGSWTATTDGFDNTAGSVQSQQQAELSANWLSNASGVLQSAAGMALRIAQDINNLAGKVSAQQQLTVQGQTEGSRTGNINNAGGQWLAGEGLTITAARIDNTQGGLLYSQRQLKLNLAGDLHNQAGKMQSGEAFQLDAQTLNNAGGNIDSQQQLTLQLSGQFDNNGGAVRSNGGQQINAATINNRQGVFSSREAINLTTGQLENASGTLISQGAGSYHVGTLNNQQGKVHSGAALTLEAAQLNNQGGQLVATQDLVLNATAIDNSTQGVISSQAGLSLQADRLINRDGGLLLGTTHTDISARDIANSAGRLQSAGTLMLRGVAQLDNRQGRVLASGDLTLNGDLSPTDSPLVLLNQSGRLESAGALSIHAHSFDNQGGTLLGLQALTLSAQQDYTRQASETISSNGTVTVSLSGAFTNLVDWLLPGNLVLNAAGITNPAMLVGKTVQLTTVALLNSGRLEADDLTLNVDSLDNRAALMGDEVTVRGRVIDNHGQPAVIAATQNLTLQARERLSNTDGALLYSGNRLSLHSDDLIENRASFIEADGDMTLEARRLDNLREGLVIEREAETSDYKWHRYNYYWRSYGSAVSTDLSTMASTTQQLTFQDEAAAQSNPYGTLLAIDAVGKRAQVRVMNNQGVLTDLWVNYLALNPSADGTYAMTFYETRGFRQNNVSTPYQNTVWREHDRGRLEQWDPEKHIDIDNAPFVTDYNNFRERTATGTITRDRLVSEGIGARILAGGNMILRITGALLNDASVITANGNLTLDGGGSIDNRGYSVNERRQEVIVDHYDKDTHHWYPTFNSDETTALATVDGIITGNGNVSINGASISNTTVNQAQISQLEAALQAVDAERAEYERNPLAFAVDGVARHDGDTELTTGNNTTGRPLLPAELALTALQQLEKVATTIPNNGLFSQHTAAGSPYLIVTDERFTSKSKFISSDYLLERVGYDPSQVHKRLGDGFYEQRLVREQVLKLTGRPSVNGWDAMAQYQELMNNGSKVAQDFHLVPGMALTPQQIAALQQDIVWLVSETVDTADGPQTVWVPKVYLAQTTLRLTGAGAVIGGGNLQLSADSVTNAGNLFADQALSIDSGQFQHLGGDITAGSIDVKAETLTISTDLQNVLRQATMSAEDISLSGTDIRLQGAKLNATNNLSLSAHNNLEIGAAKSSHSGSLNVISGAMGNRTSSGIEEAGRRMAQVSGEWQQAQGSELNAGGNLLLSAGRDLTLTGSQASITATASTLHSELGAVALQAKQDVTLNTATERALDFSEERSERKGFLKKSSSHTITQDGSTRENGSLLSGESVTVIAGRDLTVTGSAVAADQDVSLRAGRDVEIGAATETDSHYQLKEKKKSGLLGSGGIGFTIGKQSTRHEIDEKGTTQSQSVSTIGSSQGSVDITAGNRLHVGGADLVAGQDMNLTGDSVTIDPGFDSRSRKETFEQKQSGLSIALSGTAGSALNTAVSSAQQARKSGGGRVSALQNTQAALNGVQVAQAAQMDGLNTAAADAHNAAGDLKPGQDGYQAGSTNTIGVSASYGSQSSKRETRTESSQSKGSTLTAGRNLTVTATGKNGTAQSGDISIAGSQLKAGGDLGLDASRDILLQSAQNTQSTDGKNSSKGGSVGVGIGVGSGGYGISVSASINAAKGSEKGNGLTHSETTLDAGNRLSLTSGRDITLTGAQANGESVKVDAGRNLTLTSEQDSDRYDSKQQSASAGGSFTFGSMTGSANVNVSRDKMHSTWQSVAEQTGIFAGKGGFDVTVGEHTQLNGAVIASTADASLNKLDTGTLGFGNIENHAEYEVEHQSAGISTGGSIGGQFAGNMANGMLAGLNDSGSADSTTKAAVSEGTIVIRDKEQQTQDVADLSRDVANANPGLDVIFDKEKEQNRLKAAQLIGEIGAQAGDIARTQGDIIATRAANEKMSGATQTDRDRALAELKAKDPTKQYSASDVNKQVYSNYYNQAFAESGFGTGGKVQQAISAVTAAVQGLSGGNVAQALSGAASPYLAEQIHKLTEGNPEAQAMAHAVVGAVASYASGNSALAGAAGAVSGEVMAKLVMNHLYPGKAVSGLTETEKQTISALGTLAAGLAGGVVGDSAAGAVAGAQAGQNAVNNNLFGGTEAGQKKFVQKQGKDVMSCADDPSSVSCQRGEAVNKAIAGALATGGVASLTAPAQAMWALGAGVNAGAQYAEDGTVNPVNSVVAGWTNVITIGNGLTGTVIWNAVGGALTNQINGDDPLTGAITNGAGSALGYGAGKLISSGTNAAGKWITGGWDPKFNPDLLKYTEVKGQLGISKEMLPSKYPSAAGNVGASYVSEKSGNILQDQIKSNGDAN
ncbi:hemagglutinin repeat-containing protein [Pantoea agglomerans]|uniref:two-partner secretion domain-containing protein n=1 Tax=Enterobacter agglomerans TaxID=549 RepID=UPI001654313C|nr:hemagglutinin repeat-containing protein [Pantoea agglomerans]